MFAIFACKFTFKIYDFYTNDYKFVFGIFFHLLLFFYLLCFAVQGMISAKDRERASTRNTIVNGCAKLLPEVQQHLIFEPAVLPRRINRGKVFFILIFTYLLFFLIKSVQYS